MHAARQSLLLVVVLTIPLALGCGKRGGREFPARRINILAPASPGGGWDQTARAMQTALSRNSRRGAQVYNVPGAGGTVGLAQFVSDHAGDPHQWMVGGLVLLGAIRTNDSPVTLDQVTPIASLTAEWEAVVVPADSRYQTFQQLIEDFKANPAGISWGGGSAGGTDHILAGLIARAVGVEPEKVNYIAHAGGGEAMIGILSGAVTVGITGVSEARDQVEAGLLRWLAVSSDRRVTAVDAPTIREAGLDLTLANWRGVFGPPGLSDVQRDTIIGAVKQMRETEEWKQALRKYGWNDFFKTGADFSAFLDAERTRVDGLQLQARPGGVGVAGPRFFPLIVTTGLIVLGGIFLLRLTAFPDRQLARHIADEKSATDWVAVGLTALALIVYALTLRPLGYVAATALFYPAVTRVLGSRRLIRDVSLGVTLGVVIYVVFICLLGIRLPGGFVAALLAAVE